MKILHYCESFSPLSETFIYDNITELEKQGVDNIVVTTNRVNNNERPFDKVTELKVPKKWDVEKLLHRFFVILKGDNPIITTWTQIRRQINKSVHRANPDIIHAHFGPMGVIIAPVAQKLNIPLIVTFYGFDISKLKRQEFWREKYLDLWNQVSAVTVLSLEMKKDAIEMGCPESKIHIVHLSRELTNIQCKEVTHPIVNFISVGRLTDKKGHMFTIKVFEKLREEGLRLNLEIIGDGEERIKLEEYIVNNNLTDEIKLLGPLSNQRTMEKLYESDAFILTCKTAENGDKEGTPTVFVEAQAIGLPCISTKHSGIPEMFPNNNQWMLAEEEDMNGILQRIRLLLQKSKQELVDTIKVGQEHIFAQFNLTKEVDKLKTVYSQILK